MGLDGVAFMGWLSWGGVLVGCDMGLDVDYWHESMGPEFWVRFADSGGVLLKLKGEQS